MGSMMTYTIDCGQCGRSYGTAYLGEQIRHSHTVTGVGSPTVTIRITS